VQAMLPEGFPFHQFFIQLKMFCTNQVVNRVVPGNVMVASFVSQIKCYARESFLTDNNGAHINLLIKMHLL